VRSAAVVPAESAVRAVLAVLTQRAPVEAVVVAGIMVVVAAALAARRVIIPAEVAEAVAALRTSSQAPRTCICGKAGKTEPETGLSFLAGNQKTIAVRLHGFANAKAKMRFQRPMPLKESPCVFRISDRIGKAPAFWRLLSARPIWFFGQG
jgi:hypothetical protein